MAMAMAVAKKRREQTESERTKKRRTTTRPPPPISEDDSIIHATIGDAFCWTQCHNLQRSERHQTVDRVLGAYKGLIRAHEDAIHVVTLSPDTNSTNTRNTNSQGADRYRVTVTLQWPDPTPIDSTNKIYKPETIGGWPCMCEENWDAHDKKIRALLHHELKAAVGFLPPHAREYLMKTDPTPFYINSTAPQYGPRVAPITAEGFCYHPDSRWLRDNGMSQSKAKCIEMYQVSEYYEDLEIWGPGGSLLHELSHAYHDKMVEHGFDNALIKKCYREAMAEGLYDNTEVRNGGCCSEQEQRAKHEIEPAYACTDPEEYFAELSTAFLGGLDPNQEYNKWQPFNRAQLRKFDPRAYEMLKIIWKVDCDDDDDQDDDQDQDQDQDEKKETREEPEIDLT